MIKKHWKTVIAATSILALVGMSSAAMAAPLPSYQVKAFNNDLSAAPSLGSFLSQNGAQAINNQNVPLQLSDTKYYVVHGVQQSNGQYAYPYNVASPHGQYIGTEEIAINPTNHTQLIEVGVASPASVAAVPQPRGSQATSTVGSLTDPNPGTGTDPSTSGYYEVVWHDPIDASMTIVKDNISFTYDGTYVDSFSGSDYRWWYSDDGWFAYGHSIGSYYNTSADEEATVWTYQMFQNNVFGNVVPTCGEKGDTYIAVDDNNVHAYGNGSVTGQVNTYAYGGCYGYLGYYTITSGGA